MKKRPIIGQDIPRGGIGVTAIEGSHFTHSNRNDRTRLGNKFDNGLLVSCYLGSAAVISSASAAADCQRQPEKQQTFQRFPSVNHFC
jgi:hypothetical protein